jgi:hypothetical protein
MFGINRTPILLQDYHYLQTDWIELLLEPRYLEIPPDVSKIISERIVCLAQTMHTTISKRTELSFYLSLVTWEYHRVCPKWFLSQSYVWHKPCTYLMSRLPLSPNGLNRGSTWVSSPRSTIGCVQNDFWAYEIFGANRAPILHWHLHCLQTDQNEITHDPRHLEVP